MRLWSASYKSRFVDHSKFLGILGVCDAGRAISVHSSRMLLTLSCK